MVGWGRIKLKTRKPKLRTTYKLRPKPYRNQQEKREMLREKREEMFGDLRYER